MRIVIAGGGTGGHLYPGIALAEEMIRREPDTEVIFIGTERGIEAKVIPREGFIIKFIPSEGFVGKSTIKKARSVYLFLKGLKESYRYLEEIKPDIVVGSGGYASFAPLVGAWLLSIPTLILEQNTVPGRANRILGHIAKLICITYQESMARFPRSKVYLTGNPVRGRLLKGSRTSALRLFSLRKDLFTVFVFGGSSGASAINRAEVDALQHMLEFKDRIQFLHQTGEKDFEFVRDSYRSYGFKGTVAPYIFQMPEAYAIADLVISRAGATTIAEVCATGKPSVLIPYPHAAGNHQEVNAEKLQSLGATVMIRDAELTGKRLADEIKRFYSDRGFRESMGRRAVGFGRPEAVKRIADIVVSLVSPDSPGRSGIKKQAEKNREVFI
ncbi:MAG TPA: undecaprenyldiphospho-muramoylpentapeptide beta-N-acetylglucosaminyltransferase [Nitrospirae bacterium]|nr:UDP-N-acetylglucosamine--N-acetylmuramyl-(pentapeptide) pyrophosphoryl-undecaprenol N-acetylglucosamine transferase [bacterium BMS3Abin08]HDO36352.1 undecaprenyldiphospho-muramoylpentapeptide beta-N-acetylglucosaminyltransferase [Nitrospirota bacterium]